MGVWTGALAHVVRNVDKMKVLVTGNMGYVGPVLTSHLRRRFPDATLVGFDNAYFAHCLTVTTALPERVLDTQYFGDVRDFPAEILKGCDAVVHLAAVSNDPMGNRFEAVTEDINYRAGIEIAKGALRHRVGRFVFASSCSMYGFAEGGARKETDALNPLTAYARSKVATEEALRSLGTGDTIVTSLRFATACGMSPRLRLDLVLNDFVACAVASGEITVLSDGKPWRPLIDVKDMARAIEWALVRDGSAGGRCLSVNAGCDEWNYQVKDLAEAVSAAVPGTRVSINKDAPPDRRSYSVDFSLFKRLAPEHQPLARLNQTISELREGLGRIRFADKNFRNSQFMRLKVLEGAIAARYLDSDLKWTT